MAAVEKQELVVLLSGGGSTMNAIGEATSDGRLPRTHLSAVISSDPEAGGISKAPKLGVPEERVVVVDPLKYPLKAKDPGFADEVLITLRRFNPDVIGQYGWDEMTPGVVIDEFPLKMINQHPGPVDPSEHDIGGYNMSCAPRVHAAAIMYTGEIGRFSYTGVTAQRVAKEFDRGVVLIRKMVPIGYGDTVNSLQNRAIQVEWAVQIDTLRDFEDGKVVEQPPLDDFCRPEEYRTLDLAKAISCMLYLPNGVIRLDRSFRPVMEKFDSTEKEIRKFIGYLNPHN